MIKSKFQIKNSVLKKGCIIQQRCALSKVKSVLLIEICQISCYYNKIIQSLRY